MATEEERVTEEGKLELYPDCGADAERFSSQSFGCDRCSRYQQAVAAWNDYAAGRRTTFATGAMRSADANGVRYDLISTVGLRRLAETYAEGARKYGADNWRNGFPFSDLLNHLQKHIELFKAGDASEDHLAHAAWGLFTMMHFQEEMPRMDDRYKAGATT